MADATIPLALQASPSASKPEPACLPVLDSLSGANSTNDASKSVCLASISTCLTTHASLDARPIRDTMAPTAYASPTASPSAHPALSTTPPQSSVKANVSTTKYGTELPASALQVIPYPTTTVS